VFAALAVSRWIEDWTGWFDQEVRAHHPPLPHESGVDLRLRQTN
jgi:hypothetical protein